jgi:hypothetical protein
VRLSGELMEETLFKPDESLVYYCETAESR